jgi:hypothetical protein
MMQLRESNPLAGHRTKVFDGGEVYGFFFKVIFCVDNSNRKC